MSFYRKYRPQVIDEIDNVAVKDKLLALLSKDKKDLPHAYFFSGPRGAGKTTAARVIAKMLNCTSPTKTGPCGTCEQCSSIASGRNLDVLEIDAASNRGIDEIRLLRDAINLAPSGARYKIYIIDEVHMLTTEAFNALLKTLEEPPAHAVFVLATTDPHKVPVTITSRCVPITFNKASPQELLSALARIVKDEKMVIEEDALQLITESVDGSFRDAVKLLEQLSFTKGKISIGAVRGQLSLTETGVIDAFFVHLAAGNARGALAILDKAVSEGTDPKNFLTDSLRQLETQLLAHAQGTKAGVLSEAAIRDLVRRFTAAFGDMRISPIPQLPIELAIVEYCEGEATSDTRQVTSRSETKNMSEPTRDVSRLTSHVSRKADIAEMEQANRASVKEESVPATTVSGMLTLEKLIDNWGEVIAALKPYNHSVAGVMRSTRPKAVAGGIVTIEAFYTFHKEKLSESKTKDILSDVLKKLFGEKVKIEIVLGKK